MSLLLSFFFHFLRGFVLAILFAAVEFVIDLFDASLGQDTREVLQAAGIGVAA